MDHAKEDAVALLDQVVRSPEHKRASGKRQARKVQFAPSPETKGDEATSEVDSSNTVQKQLTF